MNWLHYLVEANIYLGVFYLCYCLFLNRETHYNLNRAYLLFSCVLAFVLPFTQLSILRPAEPEPLQLVLIPQVKNIGIPAPKVPTSFLSQISFDDVLIYTYIIGSVITLAVFAHRLYRLSLLTRSKKALYDKKYKLIQLNGDNTAFSFFNYLFIGTNVPKADTIIAHELVHIRQKHSADIVFLEILKVISWFNPLVYLLQRSLKTVHEYIADEQTAAYEQDALGYSSFLLNNAYGIQGASIAHSFFNYNLLKKRIIMLNQKRSGKLARLKYLAVLPLCGGMLCASTLAFSKDYGFIDLAPKSIKHGAETAKAHSGTIKYFKITDKKQNITAYSGNLSFTVKGVKKMYYAATVTDADISYIYENMKLNVEVIEVDAKTKLPADSFRTSQQDTLKLKKAPQPPRLKIDKKLPPPPPPIEKSAPKVVELRIDPPAVAPKPLKLKKSKAAKPLEIEIVPVEKSGKKTPPPPPMLKIEPAKTETAAPAQNDQANFYKAIARTVRYPTSAYNNHITGRVIATFKVADSKISNVAVVRGVTDDLDREVKRAIEAYSGSLNLKPATYAIPVSFTLVGADNKTEFKPDTRLSKITISAKAANTGESVLSLNEVVIAGYYK